MQSQSFCMICAWKICFTSLTTFSRSDLLVYWLRWYCVFQNPICSTYAGRTCGLVVRALASCLVGRCSCGSNLGRVVPRPQKLELASVWPSPRHNDCRREILQMRMQSSSVSGRVAYCLPIGISSSKTKCVRLRNGRSLQHPKQISARAIVDATGRTILVLCLVCTRNCVV